MGIRDFFRLGKKEQKPLVVNQAPERSKKRKRLTAALTRMPNNRVRMEISNVVQAAENALMPEYSDRSVLLDIYQKTVKDSQYISEHDKAESFLITEPFDVMKIGSDTSDKQRTELFQRPWFTSFMVYAMDVEFWGYTLLEFGQQDENGEFTDVIVFPRHHVRPFERQITKFPDDVAGISYADRETEYFLLPLGDAEDLGKLESIAIEVIWKTFARSDWSEYNERFGKPFVTFKTATDNENERDEAFQMAQKFGSDLVGVIDPDDELEILDMTSRESSDNYKSLAVMCDEYIAKMMNGQTGTGDVKAFTGSAEVHERVLTEFTKARLKRIQDVVNYKLFPFLVAHGYPLDGYEFSFYGLRSKPENTVDNKSYNGGNPAKTNQREENNFFA